MTDKPYDSLRGNDSQWAEMIDHVRLLAKACLDNTSGRRSDVEKLAQESLRMCDHVKRLHNDIHEELATLDAQSRAGAEKSPSPHEIDMAAVEQQRETHKMKPDVGDVLKALLMWRDDPADEVRKDRHPS